MSRIELIGGGSSERGASECRRGLSRLAAILATIAGAANIASIADAAPADHVDDGSRVIAATPSPGIGPILGLISTTVESDSFSGADARRDSGDGAPLARNDESRTTETGPFVRVAEQALPDDVEPDGAGSIVGWILPAIGVGVLGWWIRRRSWRLRDDGRPPFDESEPPVARWPIDPPMLAAAIAMLMLGSVVGSGAAIRATDAEPGTLVFTAVVMLGGAVVECGVAAAILLLVIWIRARAADESIGAFVARGIGSGFRIGVLAALGGIPVVFMAGTVASIAVGALGFESPADGPAHDTLRQLVEGDMSPWTVVIAILVTTAVPFTEETLYRGLIPEALRRFGLTPAWVIVAGAVVFAIAHLGALDVASLAPALTMLFVLGVILGWCAERTRGLLAPIIVHAAFNAANLLIASA